MHRVIQLTDCHLFTAPDGEVRGVASWPRFQAVLRDIRRRVPEIDLLVFSGDTAHDEALATYQAVRQALGEWRSSVRIIPGNHDDRGSLRRVFHESCVDANIRVTFSVGWTGWQVIGLDSQVPGQLHGLLGHEQREWLDGRLAATAGISTLLFLHHPPIAVHSPWLDAIGLQDAAEFERLLRRHPQVRLTVCGHVHQELAAALAGGNVFTTPAVGPQFRPRTAQLEIDPQPPAYRVIELHPDGQWSTQVLRCDTN